MVILWRYKGGYEKQPQNNQPAGADIPYRGDASEPVSHGNSVGWGLDHGGSLTRHCFSSDARVVKESPGEPHGQEASCRGRRAGTNLETLSCRITTCFDKIYAQLGPFGGLAKFQTQIRFVLRSGDSHKGRTCTFQNGTLELQDGLNLTRRVPTDASRVRYESWRRWQGLCV